MQFFLVDFGAAFAALLGYLAFVALARRRTRSVTLARRVATPHAGR
jgi:hypothetical protein